MAITNGIDWEGLTGKPMEKIDQDDINGVIVRKLISIEKNTECVPQLNKDVDRHKTYFKGIWVMVSAIGIPTILMVIGWIMEFIKK